VFFLKLPGVYKKGSAGTFHNSTICDTIMISQPMTNETIVVLSTNGMNLSQTEKPQPSNQRQDSLKKYVKDEVNVIGAIQIFCGVMVLNFGIILASASFSPHFTRVFSTLLKSGYPFTGSLCVSTVHGSLAGSILSTLSALVGFILLSITLAALTPASLECQLDNNNRPPEAYFSFYSFGPYMKYCFVAQTSLFGTLSLMLICTVLQFCLAVLTAVLWWKQAYSHFDGVSV
uniref:Membrane spanning 4-domains A6A n=1 Tax=Propithecus coquereli TaxID=379532 RepID=A0A2K6EPQ0_PROCO